MGFSDTYTVLAASGRNLEEFARSEGVALAPLAASLGIDVAIHQHPNARLSLEAFTRLLHMLETVTGDDCIGLRYGSLYQLGNSGAFGFALLNAPNVREALTVYAQYQRIIADYAFFNVELGKEECSIEWSYTGIIRHSMHFVDMRVAILCRALRRLIGEDWFPARVALMRPPPVSSVLHRGLLGSNVIFQQMMNCVSFSSKVLDIPNAGGDPRLYSMMRAACESQLADIRHTVDWIVTVKREIMSGLPTGGATLVKVAGRLGVGERSLQRRLAEAGTSFEVLLEQTRRELSDRLLLTEAPLAEISFLCGYANPSAYSRAARNWYGEPATEWRRRQKPTPEST